MVPPNGVYITATIMGNIKLVNGSAIGADSPVTIIAHESWDSFDRFKESTDTAKIAQAGPPGVSYVDLDHNRVPHDKIFSITNNITPANDGGNNYWVEWITVPVIAG